MALQLNNFETHMARAAEQAELCDFTGPEFQAYNRIEISAAAIRALLLGLPVIFCDQADEKIVRLAGPGVRLRRPSADNGLSVLQAHVTGTLELEYARMKDGGALPNLSLLACSFENEIRLSHAHMRGLSLAGSHLERLTAHHAILEGGVDMTGVHGLVKTPNADADADADKATCWIDFHGAKIQGSFVAPYAVFVAPPKRSDDEIGREGRRNALDLSHCHADSIILTPGFSAVGGVSLALAHIDGSVKLDGAKLEAVEGSAVFFDNMTVRGNISCRARKDNGGGVRLPEIRGDVNIQAAKIAGNIELVGADIDGRLRIETTEIGGHLEMSGYVHKHEGANTTYPCKVSGDAHLGASKIRGSVAFTGIMIDGNLSMMTSEVDGFLAFSNLAANDQDHADEVISRIGSLNLSLGKMHNGVYIRGIRIKGDIDCSNTTIDGDFYLTSEFLQNALDAVIEPGTGPEVTPDIEPETGQETGQETAEAWPAKAKDADGKSDAPLPKTHFYRSQVDNLYLDGARIGGKLILAGVLIDGALSATNLTVGTELNFGAYVSDTGQFKSQIVSIKGFANFWGAEIGASFYAYGTEFLGGLRLSGATIGAHAFIESLYRKVAEEMEFLRCQVKGDLELWGTRIGRNLKVSGALIEGDLVVTDARIAGDCESGCIWRNEGKKWTPAPFHCTGSVNMNGAEIGGNLAMQGARIDGYLGAGMLVVGRDADLNAVTYKSEDQHLICRFTCPGSVTFSGARIGGDFRLSGGDIGKLYFLNASIGADAFFEKYWWKKDGKTAHYPFTVKGIFSLWGTRIGQDLRMRGAGIKSWSLKNLSVGGNVQFHSRRAFFSYGRRGEYLGSIFRSLAFASFACLVGTVAVAAADPVFDWGGLRVVESWLPKKGVMVLDTGTVDTRDAATRTPPASILLPGETACGDQISPFIYATDLLIPLIDLHQEARCQVSAARDATSWRIAFMLYTLLGWGLVSWLIFDLARITASGPGGKRND